jgi:ligand-binding sensor domain-containing protein
MWIATDRGVSRLADDRLRSFTERDGLNDDGVRAVACDGQGRVVVGTERGAGELRGGRFVPVDDTHEFSRRAVHAIHPAADGSVWFAKENALTRRLPGGGWEVYQRDPLLRGAHARLVSNTVRAVATDAERRPWIGTAEGLGHLEAGGWVHLTWPERLRSGAGLLHDDVVTVAVERGGRVWVGHGDARDFEGGLGAASFSGGDWRYVSMRDGLPDGRVYRIRIDDSQAVWLATGNGAVRWDDGTVRSYRDDGELPDNHVLEIARAGAGRIAVLTARGPALFVGGKPRGLPALDDARVTALAASGDSLLLGTEARGLLRLEGDAWVSEPFFANRRIHSLTSARDGTVWVVHGAGVHRGRPGRWTAPAAARRIRVRPETRIRAAPDGSVWLTDAAEPGVLLRLADDEVERFDRHGSRPEAREGLFVDPDGTAWLGCRKGLAELGGTRRLAPPGRREPYVRAAAWDDRGRVWLGTRDAGLLRHDGRRFEEIRLAGLRLPLEITALLFDDEGAFWIGSVTEGLLRVDRGALAASGEERR